MAKKSAHEARVEAGRKFWALVELGEGCWAWKGPVRPGGGSKGVFYDASTGEPAAPARVAWGLVNGRVPRDCVVVRRCSTRGCVRPDHLSLSFRRAAGEAQRGEAEADESETPAARAPRGYSLGEQDVEFWPVPSVY